jgi:hypothetical protein
MAWIRQQQKKINEQERETRREYLERESHYVWGKRYLLHMIEEDAPPSVELGHSRLVLRVRPSFTQARFRWMNQPSGRRIPYIEWKRSCFPHGPTTRRRTRSLRDRLFHWRRHVRGVECVRAHGREAMLRSRFPRGIYLLLGTIGPITDEHPALQDLRIDTHMTAFRRPLGGSATSSNPAAIEWQLKPNCTLRTFLESEERASEFGFSGKKVFESEPTRQNSARAWYGQSDTWPAVQPRRTRWPRA